MGLMQGLLGNATEITPREAEVEISTMLVESESIEEAYRLVRDLFVFTSKRLIMVDKQGITGKKIDYHSIPYESISHFSIESAGHFDLDSELKIFIKGFGMIGKQFKKDSNLDKIQKTLAHYILK